MRVNFRKVNEALDDIENVRSYYAGGTLFIDFKYHPCVGLNLNGRGFAYHPDYPDLKQKFVVTREMQQKIQAIYKKHKLDEGRGNQEYFDKFKLEV